MPNIFKWILGIIVFLIFGSFYVYKKVPEIENQVISKVEENLKREQLDNVEFEVDGFDVSLSGNVSSPEEKARAIKACKVCGNNPVDATDLNSEDINDYDFSAFYSKASSKITLKGYLPNADIKAQVLAKAISIYGRAGIDDQLSFGEFPKGVQGQKFLDLAKSSLEVLPKFDTDSSLKMNISAAQFTGDYSMDSLKANTVGKLTSLAGDAFNVSFPTVTAIAITTTTTLPKLNCQNKINELLKVSKIKFQLNSVAVEASSFQTLNSLAGVLKQCPKWSILIEGHTDRTGNNTINRKLSAGRANAVKEKLASYGANKMKMTTIGLGSSRPLDRAMTQSAHRMNRRIEIRLQGDK